MFHFKLNNFWLVVGGIVWFLIIQILAFSIWHYASAAGDLVTAASGGTGYDTGGNTGFEFQSDANQDVTELCAYQLNSGDNQVRTIALFSSTNVSDVLASTTVDMSGVSLGSVKCTAITPVSISYGTTYYLLQDVPAGDHWYGKDDGSMTFDNVVGHRVDSCYASAGTITCVGSGTGYKAPSLRVSASPTPTPTPTPSDATSTLISVEQSPNIYFYGFVIFLLAVWFSRSL